MTYAAEVIADSTAFGTRLTTFEVCFPRFILAEVNTHRTMSRNSASSRAIPVPRRIKQVRENPFVPEAFAKNKSGMQAGAAVEPLVNEEARNAWLQVADVAADFAGALDALGIHKQWANRLIETFAWHTCVISGTEWDNFFALRLSTAAQPEMQVTAKLMKEAYEASAPRELEPGDWHLPYTDAHVRGDAQALQDFVKISVARCAAVSFERQDAEKTLEQLVARHDMLRSSGHMSPFEHQAQVVAGVDEVTVGNVPGVWYQPPFHQTYEATRTGEYRFAGFFCGNFRAPFLQYRKMLPGERIYEGE